MSRNRRQPRPTPPRAIPLITTTEARALAADLIRELAQHAGDPAAVTATLMRWTDTLDPPRMAGICMAATRLVFADCLSRVPVDQIPAGAVTLNPPPERTP
jgi:hypothetical protein